MRRGATLGLALVVMALITGLGSGTAAAGVKKLVEGTVYETTSCGISCSPCLPPCGGPIPAPQSRNDLVCTQRKKLIVCPLIRTAMPIYLGEGAVVKIRKRSSAKVLATVPVVEGHFKVPLAPGEYMARPFLPEPQCWQGPKIAVLVSAALTGPVPASLWVTNSCVAHPDTSRR